jgi:glycopeptide antibiotics resistance protein
MFRRHPILSVLTFGYLALVGWITLGPQPLNSKDQRLLARILSYFGNYDATKWINYNLVEFSANVAMFVPLGLFFLLLLGRKRAWLAMLLGVVLTVGIETAQLFIAGRVSDPRDVLANSAGTLIGVIAALIITTPAAMRARRAQRAQRAQPSNL